MNPPSEHARNAGLLDSSDHDRGNAGMTYVYPVVSRRAGGVSVGINLNPNNACNWHCIYCQVPDLRRGSAPHIDLDLLETELRALLEDLLRGDFMARRVPPESRRIVDIAISGNGEPTSARRFPEIIELVARVRNSLLPDPSIKLRLITNGSLVGRAAVREGLALLGRNQGEAWFKLDAATHEGMARINGVALDPAGVVRRLRTCASLCPTWVQTCCFLLDGLPPDETEILAWLQILEQTKASLAGVHLYGLARPSLQQEAPRLKPVPTAWMESLAERTRSLGLTVRVSP